jgi:predicted nucleic acid-binding protein
MGIFFADEFTEYHKVLRKRIQTAQTYAPNLLPVEVGNVLAVSERRNRITQIEAVRIIKLVGALKIHFVDLATIDLIEPLLNLARQYNLTVYDAQYLYVAMQHELPLFTLDKGLRNAASKAGVVVM